MSTPEQTPETETTELDAHRRELAALYEHATNPTRTNRAISWAGWHLGEALAVTVPFGFALTVWDGFYALSGLAAVCWAAHETRQYFQQRAVRAASEAKKEQR